MKSALFASVLALSLPFSLAVIAGASSNRLSGPSAAAAEAAEIYSKQCGSCHGKDGRGKTFKGKLVHARDLTDPEWQGNVSDERIFNSITRGKGKMPAFGKKLPEDQIDSLVTYVRSFKK